MRKNCVGCWSLGVFAAFSVVPSAYGDGHHDDQTLTDPPLGSQPVEVAHGGVEPHTESVSGHHSMTHPFLIHMGLPDGPGEVSVRLSGVQRATDDESASDVAFHVEAGIVDRLGLHLRNDAISGAGMGAIDGEMEDHGTELMLMYAVLQDDEMTRGVSVIAEVSVPTVRRDGPSVRYGGGLSGRFILATRLQWDGLVHVSPSNEGVGFEYESSAVVRAAGRIFAVVETQGEFGHEEPTNYVLFASKVGLGESGATVGAGVQVATTEARRYDRQALLQIDWSF